MHLTVHPFAMNRRHSLAVAFLTEPKRCLPEAAFTVLRLRESREAGATTGPLVLVCISALSDGTIYSATEQDIEAVLCLWDAAGGHPTVTDTREGMLALLASDGGALLLAGHDGAVVGSLIAAWDGWRGSFYRLAVHPDRRRQGIATALLREGERRLRARGAIRLTAIVAENDPGAVGFWQAAGYVSQRDRVRFVRLAED